MGSNPTAGIFLTSEFPINTGVLRFFHASSGQLVGKNKKDRPQPKLQPVRWKGWNMDMKKSSVVFFDDGIEPHVVKFVHLVFSVGFDVVGSALDAIEPLLLLGNETRLSCC